MPQGLPAPAALPGSAGAGGGVSALTQLCDVTKTYAAQLGCKPEASCVASLTQARDGYGPACAALYDDYSSCLTKAESGPSPALLRR